MKEKEIVQGIPNSRLKSVLKASLEKYMNLDLAMEILRVDETTAFHTLKEMEKAGYLAKVDIIGAWTNTMMGEMALHQPVKRRISKIKAECKINGLYDRIDEVNSDNKYLFKIIFVFVLGDFLNKDADEYSEVDVCVVLERKDPDLQEHKRKAIELAKADKRNLHFWEIGYYAELKVLKSLKASQHCFNLFLEKDLSLTNKEPSELIYPTGIV